MLLTHNGNISLSVSHLQAITMNTKLLSSNVKPSGLNFLENFPPDFSPYSKKTFPPPPVNIFHAHKKHKEDHKSLLDMINPFECESDYEDDEGDDYRD